MPTHISGLSHKGFEMAFFVVFFCKSICTYTMTRLNFTKMGYHTERDIEDIIFVGILYSGKSLKTLSPRAFLLPYKLYPLTQYSLFHH